MKKSAVALRSWSAQMSDRTYELALEDFNPDSFTALAQWLGFDCRATRVIHENQGDSGYEADPSLKSGVWNCETKERRPGFR